MATQPRNTNLKNDLTKSEISRIQKAMQDKEFVNLLSEYAEEIKDPANKARYEAEISQMERERGMSVVFINPKPGHVVKTRNLDTGLKVFINICTDSNIGGPTSKVETVEGKGQGLQWSIPYSQSQPREDIDRNGDKCMVYDVIFHPDSLYLGQKDIRMKDLLHSTALDALERAFNVRCDRSNIKFPKMKFKGMFRPTIIRKPLVEGDDVSEPPTMNEILPELATKPIKPTYSIKYRTSSDLQDHIIQPQDQVFSSRPKEMVVEISLPQLDSASGVDLDVQERSLSLTRDQDPAYALHLDLPYPVDEEAGSAKFDKTTKCLSVTLPVKPAPQLKAERLSSNDSGIEVDTEYRTGESSEFIEEQISEENEVIKENVKDHTVDEFRTKEKVIDSFLDENIDYSLPSFTTTVPEGNVIIITLEVKNVVPDSLQKKLISDRLAASFSFSSIGSGFVEIHHAFAFDFLIGGRQFDENEVEVEFWDNNVIIQLVLSDDMDTYKTGLSLSHLDGKELRVEREHGTADEGITMDKKCFKKKNKKYKQERHPKVMPQEEKEEKFYFEEKRKERHSSGESLDSFMSESPMETIELEDGKTETESCDEDYQIVTQRYVRAFSEDSEMTTNRPRGILKRKTSAGVEEGSSNRFRCYSESNVVDLVPTWNSTSSIAEDDDCELSASQKKSVRFNEQVQQQFFRINSAIIANSAKNKRKADKKKRALERRMSEGDSVETKKGMVTSNSVQDMVNLSKDWGESQGEDSGLASSFEENLVLTGGDSDKKPSKGKKMTKKRTKQFQMSNELIFDLDI